MLSYIFDIIVSIKKEASKTSSEAFLLVDRIYAGVPLVRLGTTLEFDGWLPIISADLSLPDDH